MFRDFKAYAIKTTFYLEEGGVKLLWPSVHYSYECDRVAHILCKAAPK